MSNPLAFSARNLKQVEEKTTEYQLKQVTSPHCEQPVMPVF